MTSSESLSVTIGWHSEAVLTKWNEENYLIPQENLGKLFSMVFKRSQRAQFGEHTQFVGTAIDIAILEHERQPSPANECGGRL